MTDGQDLSAPSKIYFICSGAMAELCKGSKQKEAQHSKLQHCKKEPALWPSGWLRTYRATQTDKTQDTCQSLCRAHA